MASKYLFTVADSAGLISHDDIERDGLSFRSITDYVYKVSCVEPGILDMWQERNQASELSETTVRSILSDHPPIGPDSKPIDINELLN